MSSRPSLPSTSVTSAALWFVAELQAGRRPSIESTLDAVPTSEWNDLLPALLLAEANERRTRGETPTSRDYLPRFPAHTEVVQRVLPDVIPVGRLVEVRSAAVPMAIPVVAAAMPLATAVSVPVAQALLLPQPLAPPIDRPSSRRQSRSRRQRMLVLATGAIVIGLTAAVSITAMQRRKTGATHQPSAIRTTTGAGHLATTKLANPFAPTTQQRNRDRELAEWVLSIAGRGTLVPLNGSSRPFDAEAPLPKVAFQVTGLTLPIDAAHRWKASDLERLRGCALLSAVHLEHQTALTEARLTTLAGLPLQSLELIGDKVEVSGEFVGQFAELQMVTIRTAPAFADNDLASIGQLRKLTSLTLNAPKLTAAGFRRLTNPELRALSFGVDMSLSVEHVRQLQSLQQLESIEVLNGLTDDAFLEFAVCPNMKQIRLRRTAITDSGLRTIAGHGKLEELQIVGSSISGSGLEYVAERTRLKLLDLSGARVDDEALSHLLELPALRELRLAGCRITDRGANLIAQIDRLEVLDLSNTAITDTTLALLTRHQSLRALTLAGTKVTPAAVAAFERGTPNCKIILRRQD